VLKETVQAGLRTYPEEIQRLHGKYLHLPTIERDLLNEWPVEDLAKREKLVIRRRREGMTRGSARTSATKELKKVRENRERAKRGEPPIPPTPRAAAASGSAASGSFPVPPTPAPKRKARTKGSYEYAR
jgi:hypothetical protein